MISDEKFYEKAKEFALLKNVDGQYFTLNDYADKVKPNQTDKDSQVIYLYTSDKGKQDAFIQTAKSKAYDVLQMDGVLDNHFIGHLEQKLEKTQLKRVDSEIIDKLIVKSDAVASVLSKEEEEQVKGIFEKAISNKAMSVAVESLSPDDMPVTITMSEWMRRMKDMAKTGGGGGMSFMGSMPDNYNVAVNANHPIVQRILKAENEDQKTKLAKQAYDLGLLSQSMLTGADLTAFIKRSVELVG
jgi:molecular chaperone HtpG